jgi:hypothetical protein
MSWLHRLLGREELPEGFAGTLTGDERVLASATARGGAPVVATSLGVWLPEGRLVGWHLVSKATWADDALWLVEADECGTVDEAVLLMDRSPRQLPLEQPGRLPELVHARVTGSIRARQRVELPGGGAWFLRRSVPGRDGLVLQVRPDPGTDEDALRAAAPEAIARLRATPG